MCSLNTETRWGPAGSALIARVGFCESLWAFFALLRVATSFAAATRKQQLDCSECAFIQTANGGMQFVWNALLPTIVSPQSNSSAPASG